MQQKEAEMDFIKSEEFPGSVFESSPAPMLVYTGDEMILQHANKKMLEVLGSDASIIGRSIFETMPTLRKSAILDHYNRVRATRQEHHEKEGRVELLKGGKSYWGYFDYTYAPLTNAEGKVYGVICTAIDVTDRVIAQQNQEQKDSALQNAVKLAELGTWTMDVNSGVMVFSERHSELWGFDSLETTAEQAISHIIEEDRERVSQAFYKALRPGSDGRYEAEYSIDNPKTGERLIVRAIGQTYYDKEGKPITIAGTTQDITVQRKMQLALEAKVQERTKELAQAIESLNVLNKELQRSNNYLEEFTYAASHDLKEPVRKIRFFIEQLTIQMSSQFSEQQLNTIKRIENAIERMANLIDDLLLYSHVSQVPHEKEWVNLNEVINRVLEDLELEIEEKGAKIIAGHLPSIRGYHRQLQQLFQNLISNAVKYCKPNSHPHIEITTSEVKENDKTYHCIQVKDDGIGFDQKDGEKIFQMFTRLHGKDQYSGTGVGLSIAKKIVENHHGMIEVDSDKGVGSVFKVYVPASDEGSNQ